MQKILGLVLENLLVRKKKGLEIFKNFLIHRTNMENDRFSSGGSRPLDLYTLKCGINVHGQITVQGGKEIKN